MFPPSERWQPRLNWDTPAGRLLDRAIAALPTGRPWEIIVFGSAPLQLGLDPGFVSGDVDLIADGEVESLLSAAKLLKDQNEFYLEVCQPHVFAAPADWRNRAHTEMRQQVRFIFPHPIDILTAKVVRMADKDFAAFRLVRRLTGHPTPEEMIRSLRSAVDIYRPRFDEEQGGDPVANTRLLWREIFGADIDVREQIIRPALAERRPFFDQSVGESLKERLRQIGEMGEPR